MTMRFCPQEAEGPLPVPGFDGLLVTEYGDVFIEKQNVIREMKQSNASGYRVVSPRLRSGKTRTVGVHRLVAMAFWGAAEGRMACHKNDVRADNRALNLYWGTARDNSGDARRNGRMPVKTVDGLRRHAEATRGEKNTSAKLCVSQVLEIRARRARGETLASIARAYGVTEQMVFRIHWRKAWRHV